MVYLRPGGWYVSRDMSRLHYPGPISGLNTGSAKNFLQRISGLLFLEFN